MTENFPDPVAQRVLSEAGGDFNEAVRRLLSRSWFREEAEQELRLCLQSKEAINRARRKVQPRRANHGKP